MPPASVLPALPAWPPVGDPPADAGAGVPPALLVLVDDPADEDGHVPSHTSRPVAGDAGDTAGAAGIDPHDAAASATGTGPHAVAGLDAAAGPSALADPAAADPADAAADLADAADAADADVDGVAQLWGCRGGGRDRAVRDLLVAHYAPLVRGVAARIAVGLPASVDVADLVQAGVFGLLDAITRFDPGRGIRFESYAAQRIRGAMLDELRAQDWVPRTVRTRLREIDRARERLERGLGRSPANAELAAELGISTRDLLRLSQHRRLVSVEALRERRPGAVAEDVVDDAAPDPAAAFALRETYRELAEAVLGLEERDRLVVQLYYVENRTLAEIGALLGVTESRVCQLHGRLVGRLRGRMDEAVAG
ncbi:FliA/WhiG family RNA polymerase sigma factor [Pseudonocardia sp.]|uniref:FliA/WhiG family RNA polymerase sigma factor n=1 Tax=Pseudonocardia sp. TaxID=60912 RepID=UPI003D1402B9